MPERQCWSSPVNLTSGYRRKIAYFGNSADAVESTATCKIEYLSFQIVIGIVRGCENFDVVICHHLGKKIVSRLSCSRFKAFAFFFCKNRYINA